MATLRNIKLSLSSFSKRSFSTTQSRASDYSHIVIGGGVVGTSIAAKLAQSSYEKTGNPASVLLVERHDRLGTETSARNSGVIHAGLYFHPDALRTKLCIRGKNLIYKAAEEGFPIQLQKCGKWIVAQSDKQAEYLENMKKKGDMLNIPLEFVPLDKAKAIEPAIKANTAILNSSSTGIVEPDSITAFSEAQLEKYGGDISLLTTVTGLEKTPQNTYKVTLKSGDEPEITLEADAVINSAGHGAVEISNMLLPESRHLKAYYAKGNYFLYTASHPKVKRLVYPCPSDYGSLGTHLTIDMGGQIKFGPDFEWVSSPLDLAPNPANLERAIEAISEYMVGLDYTKLVPDYSGIRPKIVNDKRFQDFVIRKEEGFSGFVNLLNIESPGLTSSLAIAEYVDDIYKGK